MQFGAEQHHTRLAGQSGELSLHGAAFCVGLRETRCEVGDAADLGLDALGEDVDHGPAQGVDEHVVKWAGHIGDTPVIGDAKRLDRTDRTRGWCAPSTRPRRNP